MSESKLLKNFFVVVHFLKFIRRGWFPDSKILGTFRLDFQKKIVRGLPDSNLFKELFCLLKAAPCGAKHNQAGLCD